MVNLQKNTRILAHRRGGPAPSWRRGEGPFQEAHGATQKKKKLRKITREEKVWGGTRSLPSWRLGGKGVRRGKKAGKTGEGFKKGILVKESFEREKGAGITEIWGHFAFTAREEKGDAGRGEKKETATKAQRVPTRRIQRSFTLGWSAKKKNAARIGGNSSRKNH